MTQCNCGGITCSFPLQHPAKERRSETGGDIIKAMASGEEKPRDKQRTVVCIKIFVKIYSKKGIVEKRRKVMKNKKGK